MILVFVKNFVPKDTTVAKIIPDTVYEAEEDDDTYVVRVSPTENIIVAKEAQNGPRWDADIVKLTKENFEKFKYTQKDASKVLDYFVRPIVEKAAADYESRAMAISTHIQGDLATLGGDIELLEAVAKTLSYIVSTNNDKYEMTSEVDLTGLMRYSHHSTGFNIGNALKYCKRYLSTGFKKSSNPDDLLKAIHYLLFELISEAQQKNDETTKNSDL
jgi:hypothetical protein